MWHHPASIILCKLLKLLFHGLPICLWKLELIFLAESVHLVGNFVNLDVDLRCDDILIQIHDLGKCIRIHLVILDHLHGELNLLNKVVEFLKHFYSSFPENRLVISINIYKRILFKLFTNRQQLLISLLILFKFSEKPLDHIT